MYKIVKTDYAIIDSESDESESLPELPSGLFAPASTNAV